MGGGLRPGVAAACACFGAVVVGGDLSAASEVVVSVTALGDLQGRPPVLRSGARPGDVVAVAGVLGRSGAGLEVLQRNGSVASREEELVTAHRRPQPPSPPAPLRRSRRHGAHGRQRRVAAGRGAHRGGQRRHRRADDDRGAGEWSRALGPERGLEHVLTGGEDHALLGCFPPEASCRQRSRPWGVWAWRARTPSSSTGVPGPARRGGTTSRGEGRGGRARGTTKGRIPQDPALRRLEGGQRVTLPAFRQEVHTLRRLGEPFTVALIRWMFGSHMRLVRRCECETLLPKPGPLAQTSQVAATGNS